MPPKQSPFTPEQEQEAIGLFQQGLNASDVMRHFGATSMQKKPTWQMEQEAIKGNSQRANAIFSDIPNDIGTGLTQLGEGYQDRYGRLVESGQALARGEQGVLETGAQFATNIAGGLLADTSYQLLRTGASFGMSQNQEDAFGKRVGEAVTGVDESVGLSTWFESQSPRAQRNIMAALDLADVAPIPIIDKARGLFGGKPKPQVDSQAALQEAYNNAARGEYTADTARVVNNSVDDAAREKLVTDLSVAYQDSLVGDLKTYNRKLQEQAQGMSRDGDIVTQDDLVRALANEGIVPDIRGKLADFTAEIRRINERMKKLFEQYQPILDASPATANVNDFRAYVKRSLVGRRSMAAELEQAEARLDAAIDNIARSLGVDETGMLTAKQIDEMSRIANDRTGAYRDTDVFQADVFSELARASRLWLEENVPDNAFREVNDEWIRLNNIKETARNLQNAQIDVGLLGRAIGSYVTTIGATALAAPTGNPVFALVAGMLTKMGGDEVANWMRGQKFSPEVRDVLQKKVLEQDAALLERLKQSSTNQANRNFYDALSRQLPPARPDAPRSEVGSGAPIATGGQTPTGRVEPGITERTREGAIRQPEGERTATLTEEVLAKEISELPEADKKKLTDAGVNLNDLALVVAAGGGGLWLANEMDSEGGFLPAGLAILGVGISRGGKLSMVNKAISTNMKRAEAARAKGDTKMSDILDKQYESLIKERNKLEDGLSPGLGMKDVSGRTGTPDPTLKTKREVNAKTMSGEKFTVPAGTVIKPLIDGNKINITVGGKNYTINKNQYDNLKGQSDIAVASEFAPELKGTVETIRTETNLRGRSFNLDEQKTMATKYGQYTLDGGENYREILIQAPVEKGKVTSAKTALNELEKKGITMEDDMDGTSFPVRDGEAVEYDLLPAEEKRLLDTVLGNAQDTDELMANISGGYISSHWDEPNVISHIRMNERTVDGKKYAFMEELQSDWARDGRDKGFVQERKEITKLPDGYYGEQQPSGKIYIKKEGEVGYLVEGNTFQEARDKALKVLNKDTSGRVPNNPLLKNWQIPTTKRALMEAVDSGADRFAWINGAQTSERYNLATHVEEVKWSKTADEDSVTIIAKDGKKIIFDKDETGTITKSFLSAEGFVGKKLDEVLGKGLADKIMEKETGTLSGDGLSFGGEWAKNLYDRQVRDIVKKLTGAEVKTVDMGLTLPSKWDRFTFAEGNDVGGFIRPNQLKKGLNVTDKNGTEFTVTDVMADGDFLAFPKRQIDDYKVVKAEFSDKFKVKVDSKTFDSMAEAKKHAEDLINRSSRKFTLEDNVPTTQLQQYIDLTPEVKAKIQSKAPNFKMKDGVTVAMPLLLAYFYAGETE